MRGLNPGRRRQTFLEIILQYIWRRNRLYFAAEMGGGLGSGVSALPRGPLDVFKNYIFEISMKNWKNEPEENFLEGFFHLSVSKKRGGDLWKHSKVCYIFEKFFVCKYLWTFRDKVLHYVFPLKLRALIEKRNLIFKSSFLSKSPRVSKNPCCCLESYLHTFWLLSNCYNKSQCKR